MGQLKSSQNELRIKNANLTWERVELSELRCGLLALQTYHLNGTVEVFNMKTTDLLFWKTLPLSSGISVTSYPAKHWCYGNKDLGLNLDGDVVRVTLTWV